ncbi:MAG: N-acetyltransferase [Mangrovicoccus sp.]|nr:N-acetyltransferase [Mangrovicoccus sp.]
MFDLTTENPGDWWEVEALYDLCFGPGRTALSSYRLREGNAPVPGLSILARDDGGILAGAIRYWPITIGGHLSLLLGPIAVHPTRQGEGLGALLITDSLGRARSAGWQRVLLIGDAPYYERFGFACQVGVEMPPPTNPDRVLGLALQEGAWQAVLGRVQVAPHMMSMSLSDTPECQNG